MHYECNGCLESSVRICHVDQFMEPSEQASSLQTPSCQDEKSNECDCEEDGKGD